MRCWRLRAVSVVMATTEEMGHDYTGSALKPPDSDGLRDNLENVLDENR